MPGEGRNTNTTGKIQKKLTVYLSPEMDEEIDQMAKAQYRSYASQVVILLESALQIARGAKRK